MLVSSAYTSSLSAAKVVMERWAAGFASDTRFFKDKFAAAASVAVTRPSVGLSVYNFFKIIVCYFCFDLHDLYCIQQGRQRRAFCLNSTQCKLSGQA